MEKIISSSGSGSRKKNARCNRKSAANGRSFTRIPSSIEIKKDTDNIESYVQRYGKAKSRNKELYLAKNLPIRGGTNRKKEQILSAVSDHFTFQELRMIVRLGKGLIVKIGTPTRKTADASFERRTNRKDPFVIVIRKDADRMAILHEFIHLMRTIDKTRNGINKTPYGSDRNYVADPKKRAKYSSQTLRGAEEAATSAETALRADRLGRSPVYFSNLGGRDYLGRYEYPNKKENMRHDRNRLRTNENGSIVPDGRAVKGNEALSKMTRNYKATRISKSTFGGKTAIEISKEET